MKTDKDAVDRFLEDAEMHPRGLELEATVNHLLAEMEGGLRGAASSLPMIPTYIEVDSEIPPGRPAAVLDAGGTNLRAARVSFNDRGEAIIDKFTKQAMPGTGGGKVGREEFFDSLAAVIGPLAEPEGKIGFCFSYPTEIFPNRDGRLIHWSKEIQAPEVEGRLIGADLKAALRERGAAGEPDVVVLNDTVATLLTGKASMAQRRWGGYVAFILGTGTNTCYVESNAAIGKAGPLNPSGRQIVNCESGNYAVPRRGEADRRLGALTAKPDTYWLEKMVSGAYFGALVAHSAALACEAGLFSPAVSGILRQVAKISTKDADNYCHDPGGSADNELAALMKSEGSESDSRRLWFLIDALLERAAKLSAANLAAAVLKGPGETGPLAPACLTIDGTTYYRYYRFQHRVEQYLRPYLAERDRYCETVRVEDAPLIGAAAAALTNEA